MGALEGWPLVRGKYREKTVWHGYEGWPLVRGAVYRGTTVLNENREILSSIRKIEIPAQIY